MKKPKGAVIRALWVFCFQILIREEAMAIFGG
jgi:hypothetical protein